MRTALLLVAVTASTTSAEPDKHFAAIIKQAATDYQKWTRVDEQPNIAPELCRAPLPADYGVAAKVRLSAAEGGAHHDKLFYLWASDKAAYLKQGTIAAGFAIVKQSFSTKRHTEAKTATTTSIAFGRNPPPITWTKTPHGALEIDQPKELFIMAKTKTTGGTDDGWIYGTVATDGTVTSAGKVETCMHCHVEAPHGRLFGLPKEER
ncbi:MAG: hypothetical protein ABI678_04335 [Kofleriaceae bacterium]